MINTDDLSRKRNEIFQQTYLTYYKELLCYARRLCGDVQQAEDLTQDAFVSFFKNVGDVAPEKRRAWLYVTLRNKWFDRWRKKTKEPGGEKEENPFDLAPNATRPNGRKFDATEMPPETNAEFQSILHKVSFVRDKLKQTGKKIFSETEKEIYYWTFCVSPPLELDELAYVLNLSKESAGTLYRRMLSKIKNLFSDDDK